MKMADIYPAIALGCLVSAVHPAVAIAAGTSSESTVTTTSASTKQDMADSESALVVSTKGPTIHVSLGTTDDLEKEAARLQSEYAELPDKTDSLAQEYVKSLKKIANLLIERSNSPLTDCPAELMFNGKHLLFIDHQNESIAKWDAVSGRKKSDGTFDYSQEYQHVEDAGPIPEGIYWVSPSELTFMWNFLLWSSWGLRFLPIHPFDSTHSWGRGRFRIHGGSTPGTMGCIDIAGQTGSFKKAIQGYSACKIKLFVYYSFTYDSSDVSPN